MSQIQKPQGPPMAEMKIERDAEGNLKIECWIKDVSPAGIILGNKRPMMPIEIMAMLNSTLGQLINMALANAPKPNTQGGASGEGQQAKPTTN